MFDLGTIQRMNLEQVAQEAEDRCECGNLAEDGSAYCEWCEPHEHEEVKYRHDFNQNMICGTCRLLAQDCCEAASECLRYATRDEIQDAWDVTHRTLDEYDQADIEVGEASTLGGLMTQAILRDRGYRG